MLVLRTWCRRMVTCMCGMVLRGLLMVMVLISVGRKARRVRRVFLVLRVSRGRRVTLACRVRRVHLGSVAPGGSLVWARRVLWMGLSLVISTWIPPRVRSTNCPRRHLWDGSIEAV
nr:MAG TPA: hypothetical protein [Caudoviricetes sp.]